MWSVAEKRFTWPLVVKWKKVFRCRHRISFKYSVSITIQTIHNLLFFRTMNMSYSCFVPCSETEQPGSLISLSTLNGSIYHSTFLVLSWSWFIFLKPEIVCIHTKYSLETVYLHRGVNKKMMVRLGYLKFIKCIIYIYIILTMTLWRKMALVPNQLVLQKTQLKKRKCFEILYYIM